MSTNDSRLKSLLPRLEQLIVVLQTTALSAGIETIIPSTGGVRSIYNQWLLFHKGRVLKNGLWVPLDPIHRTGIITYAAPDKAPHCPHIDHDGSTGSAACDLAISVEGKIAWNHGDPGYSDYPKLGAMGEQLGLAWGGRWGKIADEDHFELADWRSLQLMSAVGAIHDTVY